MSIDNDALLAAIDNYKSNAYGQDSSSLTQRRAKAIEYFLGLNTNPAPEGRSQVVDRSVYETISVMQPSLHRIFAGSSDDVCKCVPIGPEDEQAAEQTTAVLSHYVTRKNNWEQIWGDWSQDALLLGMGYAMAYWDESERLIREVYEGQSEEQVTLLMQDSGVTVLQQSSTVDEQATAEAQGAYQQSLMQWQAGMQRAIAQGMHPDAFPPQPQPPKDVLRFDLVIERKENEGKVCIKVLAPEHCIVSAETPDWTLNECPYFEYREQKTIADLRLMGLDVDEGISDDESGDNNAEDQARNRFGENTDAESNKGVMRLVWARMIWVKADAENDDQSRLYYVIAVGKTILFAEPCGRIQVSSMTSEPMAHRHIGLSVSESLFDLQDIKTAVKRGGLDNLMLANNGRHAISSKVNLDDLLDSRPGGIVRMLDPDALPGEGHVMPLVHPFAFDQIIGSLEYFDQERQNRSGASRYFAGTDAGAINKTKGGTIALQNMAAMRVEHRARTMSPAVEHLFSIVQELISKHANKALTLKLKGNWVTVDPQAWRTKRDMRISVGVGAGNSEAMLQQLQMVLANQVQVGIPMGLVNREAVHSTNVEMLKLQGFANPEKYWPDPQSLPPPQPQPNPDEAKIQADMQKTQAQLQADAQKFQAETERKKMELGHQSTENEKDRRLQIELAKLQEATKITLETQKMEHQAAADAQTRQFEGQKMAVTMEHEDQVRKAEKEEKGAEEADLKGILSTLGQVIGQLDKNISRPRKVDVDKEGKKYGRQMTDEEMEALK